MALAAHFDHLLTGRLADITLLAVHALQTHDTRIAAMAVSAAETFGGMDIIFVIFGRLGEILDSEGQMAGRTGIVFGLSSQVGGCAREQHDK